MCWVLRLSYTHLIGNAGVAAVIDEEYYWAKAEDALEKADRNSVLGNYFVSIALAYRLLAFSETKFRNSRLGRAHEKAASRTNRPAQIA